MYIYIYTNFPDREVTVVQVAAKYSHESPTCVRVSDTHGVREKESGLMNDENTPGGLSSAPAVSVLRKINTPLRHEEISTGLGANYLSHNKLPFPSPPEHHPTPLTYTLPFRRRTRGDSDEPHEAERERERDVGTCHAHSRDRRRPSRRRATATSVSRVWSPN